MVVHDDQKRCRVSKQLCEHGELEIERHDQAWLALPGFIATRNPNAGEDGRQEEVRAHFPWHTVLDTAISSIWEL